ncbi:hypothetical protein [Deinococcus radiophilus]
MNNLPPSVHCWLHQGQPFVTAASLHAHLKPKAGLPRWVEKHCILGRAQRGIDVINVEQPLNTWWSPAYAADIAFLEGDYDLWDALLDLAETPPKPAAQS